MGSEVGGGKALLCGDDDSDGEGRTWTKKAVFNLAGHLQNLGDLTEKEFLSLRPPLEEEAFCNEPYFAPHEPLPFLGPRGVRFENGEPKFAVIIFFRM